VSDPNYGENVLPLQADLKGKGRGGLSANPPGPPDGDMNYRLASLEASMDGLKRIQDITVLSVFGVGAILVAIMVYMLMQQDQSRDRIDRLSDKMNELPGKINADLRDITKTLAESITAAKQQAPQVILLPAPAPPSQQTPSNQK
jgi:hypothetical protein